MLHVHGQPLNSREVELLIRALTDDGGPQAREAASTICHAYAYDHFSAQLNFDTREAICFVLAAKRVLPDALEQLRETLSRHVVALVMIS